MSPEDSWKLRRDLFGLNKTMPVDMEGQDALIAMRDSIITHQASSRGKARCGDRLGKVTLDVQKVTCDKCRLLADADAPSGAKREAQAKMGSLIREYVRLALSTEE
jgi:hypothetical protein